MSEYPSWYPTGNRFADAYVRDRVRLAQGNPRRLSWFPPSYAEAARLRARRRSPPEVQNDGVLVRADSSPPAAPAPTSAPSTVTMEHIMDRLVSKIEERMTVKPDMKSTDAQTDLTYCNHSCGSHKRTEGPALIGGPAPDKGKAKGKAKQEIPKQDTAQPDDAEGTSPSQKNPQAQQKGKPSKEGTGQQANTKSKNKPPKESANVESSADEEVRGRRQKKVSFQARTEVDSSSDESSEGYVGRSRSICSSSSREISRSRSRSRGGFRATLKSDGRWPDTLQQQYLALREARDLDRLRAADVDFIAAQLHGYDSRLKIHGSRWVEARDNERRASADFSENRIVPKGDKAPIHLVRDESQDTDIIVGFIEKDGTFTSSDGRPIIMGLQTDVSAKTIHGKKPILAYMDGTKMYAANGSRILLQPRLPTKSAPEPTQASPRLPQTMPALRAHHSFDQPYPPYPPYYSPYYQPSPWLMSPYPIGPPPQHRSPQAPVYPPGYSAQHSSKKEKRRLQQSAAPRANTRQVHSARWRNTGGAATEDEQNWGGSQRGYADAGWDNEQHARSNTGWPDEQYEPQVWSPPHWGGEGSTGSVAKMSW